MTDHDIPPRGCRLCTTIPEPHYHDLATDRPVRVAPAAVSHDLPDLVRGLRTAACTLELIDMIGRPEVRRDMLADVDRDFTRLTAILGAVRAEAAA